MKKKILLTYTHFSSFVKTDFEILSEVGLVDKYQFKSRKNVGGIFEMIKQFFFFLFKGWQYDIFFIWFADYHSFFPIFFSQIFGKKSLIVIGGFDAVVIPYLRYGLFCSNKIRQLLGKFSIRNANYVCPVDKSLIEHTNYYAGTPQNGLPVGIKNFVKGIKGKIIPISTGYDTKIWRINSKLERKESVLTVGYIPDWKRWKLKGCDFIQEIALKMPNIRFHIYGLTDNFLIKIQKTNLPQNLILYPKVDIQKLPDIYSQHKVYAQLSLSEGLPNVLCEAILCGCIPVGSDVNGIKTAIIDPKLKVLKKDVNEATRVIKTAMKIQKQEALVHYNYISNTFTIENRKSIISSLINNSKSSN